MGPERSKARLGVLISGRGSNMEAIAAACRRGELPAQVELVLSNRVEALGLARARSFGLATAVVSPRDHRDRAEFERALVARLVAHGVEWVCLAGFMRLLSSEFLGAFPARVVNVHPSLLPAFPGLEAQVQALAHGVKVSGCTVHFVDSGLDSGPIVAQCPVAVREDDTVETLSARILEAEHRTYVGALRQLLAGPWWIEGRRVRFPDRSSAGPESATRDGGVDTLPGVV